MNKPKLSRDARIAWAQHLGVSDGAIDLVCSSEVVDLHVDSFIWTRLLGYDPLVRHGAGPLNARWLFQADLPRLRQGGVSGATWVITTNPWRSKRGRLRALVNNFRRLISILDSPRSGARFVSTYTEYIEARSLGLHAAFIGIQGGNALSDAASAEIFPLERLLRVTLVHLTNSDLGSTSSPLRVGSKHGLLPRGRQLVAELESRGTLIDLAHASAPLFWDVVAAHDPSRPLLVSHTGIAAVHPHWRNIDDRQLRAVADSGGAVGVLYHSPFLGGPPWGGSARSVAAHLKHALRCIGPEHVCLGSDWDGLIATPLDMPTCLELPRLVQALLDLGVGDTEIGWILGKSALRLVKLARP